MYLTYALGSSWSDNFGRNQEYVSICFHNPGENGAMQTKVLRYLLSSGSTALELFTGTLACRNGR